MRTGAIRTTVVSTEQDGSRLRGREMSRTLERTWGVEEAPGSRIRVS